MKRFTNAVAVAIVMVMMAASAAVAITDFNPSGDTAPGQASTTGQSLQTNFPGTLPETRFKNNVRFPNQAIFGGDQTAQSSGVGTLWSGGANQWSNLPSIVLRPFNKRSRDSLDTTIIWTTPSAARTYTIPDAGSSTANFVLSTGAAGSPSFASIILTGTSFNDTVQATASQGQATTYSIPDSGQATDTFATLKNANTFTGVNTFPTGGIVLKGTSFNGTLKQLATLGQATTFSLPDPGAATDTVATLGATNAFTGVNSFSLANGITLKGTSFNDIVIAKSTQGQASTLTIHDVGGATGEIYTMTAAQTAAGVLSRLDMVTETSVTLKRNLLDGRYLDGSVLVSAAAAGKLGISTTATFGTPAQLSLVTEVANANTKTDDVEYEFTLPPDYVAGSAIDVAVTQAITIGGGTLSVKTLTVDAFKVAADGTVGSNLGPAAGTLTNSSTTLHFAITPTGLVAGNKLLLQFQTVLTETAASNVTANITDININTSVKM